MTTTTTDYRTFLAERREKLRQLYARLRTYGHAMMQRGLVRWSDKQHGYYVEYTDNYYRGKERAAIKGLLALQKNITEQAMLLLELEHALDCEDKKEVVNANT